MKNVSFSLRRGEILGFAGLMGAGRTEVARAVFGADRAQSGEIVVMGRKVSIRTPTDAVAAGIGYLSEDRKRFGLAVGMDVAVQRGDGQSGEVSVVPLLPAQARNPRRRRRSSSSFSTSARPSLTQEVRLLSGGNQQKVVVAKWLDRDCDILFFDEPTRGIDVGAKAEIYKLLRGLPIRARRSS